MGWHDNFHSWLVAWMKIVLPLAALGLLSTLFLISERFDPAETTPPAALKLAQRARDEGATDVTLAGVTRDGHEVILQTARFVPSATDTRRLNAENLQAHLRLRKGTRVEVAARAGELDQRQNTARLSGNVTFDTSTGYSMKSDRLDMRLDLLHVVSPGPVSGTAPGGNLSAGRMVLSGNKQSPHDVHLLFTNGVKLIYQPKSSGE